MANSQLNGSISDLRNLIMSWLESQLDSEGVKWLLEKSENMLEGAEDWEFFTSFSAVPHHTGDDPLSLSEEQKQAAEQIRTGWKPEYWSVDELGRTLLVMSISEDDKQNFLERLEKTFISSDMGEAEALYKALPLLPFPNELTDRGAEGLRSNMTSVFNAVALHNPFPADYFDEGAWNQLVLKALFVQSPLYKIQGIDERVNKTLADILVDYAHERWAADRTVSPELWRPVGPFATGNAIEDLKNVLNHSDKLQRHAAILALSASQDDDAQKLVENHRSLLQEIKQNNITWDDIGERSGDYR